MKINEIIELDEKTVDSSWISRVDYGQYYRDLKKDRSQDQNKKSAPKVSDVIITVKDGRKYTVHDVPHSVYKNWAKAPSKGQFWHRFIRDRYRIS
jgi:hypothetical protein